MKEYQVKLCLILFCVNVLYAKDCDEELTKFEFIQKRAIRCEAEDNLTEDQSLKALKDKLELHKTYEHFAFDSHKILALPHDTFKNNNNLKSLTLRNFNLDLLLEPTYGSSQQIELKGFENLVTLEVTDTKLLFGWKWIEMGSEMQNLKNLKFSKSDLYYVSPELLNLAKNFRYIDIQSCNVYWTEKISRPEELEWVSFRNNKLTSMPEDFISVKAPKLRYLDLSFNSLDTLHENFTENMIALEELNLKYNKFKTITEAVLKPIWGNLKYLWINGNPLILNNDMETQKMCFLALKVFDDNYITSVMYWYTAFVELEDYYNVTFSNMSKEDLYGKYCQRYHLSEMARNGNEISKNQMNRRSS